MVSVTVIVGVPLEGSGGRGRVIRSRIVYPAKLKTRPRRNINYLAHAGGQSARKGNLMFKTISAAAGAIIVGLVVNPAHGLTNRTWVSGKATSDQSGCGPVQNPCRTLQFAHDNTNPGGEIDVLDSAGYGNLTITKAITIVGDGSIAGVLATAGQNGITINAGASDNVVLRGLTIEGGGVGKNGIVLTNAGSLTVDHCAIQGFGASQPDGNGILMAPQSGSFKFKIVDSSVQNTSYVGIHYFPGGGGAYIFGEIAHTYVSGTTYGISMNLSGTAPTAGVTLGVDDTIVSQTTTGLFLYGLATNNGVLAFVENSRLYSSLNINAGTIGINLGPNTSVYLGRSRVSAWATGIKIDAAHGAAAYTHGDNHFAGNSPDFFGATPTVAPPQ